jgi:hypothetical protein
LTAAAAGAGRGEEASAARPGPGDPLGRIVFAVLVVACFGAFFLTQRLKHTPTVIHSFELAPYFSPYPGGHVPQEAISIKLADADEVTITIIDSQGDTVASLVRDFPVARYKEFSLRWSGRRGVARGYAVQLSPSGKTRELVPRLEGPLAAPGEYRVHVSLRHHSYNADLPRSFTLVRG